MSALTPDNVVLIPGGEHRGAELSLRNRTNVECLALEDDGPAESGRPGLIEGTAYEVEMVLAGELPIDLSGKGGVVVEAQIFLQVDSPGLGAPLDGSRWVGVEPEAVNADLVRIEIVRVVRRV